MGLSIFRKKISTLSPSSRPPTHSTQSRLKNTKHHWRVPKMIQYFPYFLFVAEKVFTSKSTFHHTWWNHREAWLPFQKITKQWVAKQGVLPNNSQACLLLAIHSQLSTQQIRRRSVSEMLSHLFSVFLSSCVSPPPPSCTSWTVRLQHSSALLLLADFKLAFALSGSSFEGRSFRQRQICVWK